MARAASTVVLVALAAVSAACAPLPDIAPAASEPDSGPGVTTHPGGHDGGAGHDAGVAQDAGTTSAGDSSPGSSPDAAPPPGLLIGYYASWATTFLPETAIDWTHLTHVAHAFALPKSGGGLANAATFPDDALVTAAHANGVKVVASVGGASADFTSAVTTNPSRAATVAALVALCSQHGYDGIDVDWEFPDTTTIGAWVSFMNDLRAGLDAVGPGLSLSTTVSRDAVNSDILPVASLAKLSWVGAMTYRYTGGSDAVVGPFAPLHAPSSSEDGSVTGTVQHLLARGVPASLLVLGFGFYGEQFADGPPGSAISSPSAVTTLDQSSIAPLLTTSGWTHGWDTTASEPSLLGSNKAWISYEDTASIAAKCAYAHATGLGGAMVWHMASGVLADGSQPLLTSTAACK